MPRSERRDREAKFDLGQRGQGGTSPPSLFSDLAEGLGLTMNFSQMKDERLLAFYENVRQQVELDQRAGGRYRFAGPGVKEYAERLREEMDRRRLHYNPIDWS